MTRDSFARVVLVLLGAVAALAAKPSRFTKDMLRHGLEYVRRRYGQPHAVGDLPPVLAAGQQDLQSSLTVPR